MLAYVLPLNLQWLWYTGAASGVLYTVVLAFCHAWVVERTRAYRLRIGGLHPLPLALALLYLVGVSFAMVRAPIDPYNGSESLLYIPIAIAGTVTILGLWLRSREAYWFGMVALGGCAALSAAEIGIVWIAHLLRPAMVPSANGPSLIWLLFVAMCSFAAGFVAMLICITFEPRLGAE